MKTKYLSFDETEQASALLNSGEVVGFPTETVFGLGVVYDSKPAFDKLVEVKNRPEKKPFTLMCSSSGEASRFCFVNAGTIAVMKRFMPGEITVIAKARPGIPYHVTMGSDFIGLRVPGLESLRKLIEKVGKPLLVPSANKSGEPPACSAEQCKEIFDGEIAAIIEGKTTSNIPSTIVKIDGDDISLIRKGPIDFDIIKEEFMKASLKVSIGSDHGAFDLKEKVKAHLSSLGVTAIDVGTYSAESCDYPFFAEKACRLVVDGKADFAIVLCTSGEGVAMAANKVKGIRCGIGYDDEVTLKCREHNNANAISFGAKYMQEADVLRRIDLFLSTEFSKEEKHHRRVSQLDNIK